MTATIINSIAIMLGGVIGWQAAGLLPARVRETLLLALGVIVLGVGVEMMLQWQSIWQVIVAVVVGAISGEKLQIEARLERAGQWVQRLAESRVSGNLGEGFVYGTLIYCVGPMAVLGALESGVQGTQRILLAKAAIDGLTAIAFASTLGPGVLVSSVSVFVYQGLLTVLAQWLEVFVAPALPQLTATGGVLIVGLGLKILQIKEMRVANLLPALPLVVVMAYLF